MPLAPLLTITELGTYLRMSRSTIERAIKRGMPALKVANEWRFRLDLIEQWMAQQTVTENQNNG